MNSRAAGFAARRALRWSLGNGMRVIRSIRPLPGHAHSMISVETLMQDHSGRDDVKVARTHRVEAARVVDIVSGSDPFPALDAVDTTVSIVDVRDPRFSLRDRYLVDPRSRVVYEEREVPSFPFRRVAMVPLEKPSPVSGVVACLAQETNYGHWLLLALPFVKLYREYLGRDPDYYYLGSPVHGYQIETLELLGIPESKILREAVTADRLLVAIADRRAGYDTDFLVYPDEAFLPELRSPQPPGRRIFVSRARNPRRRVVNEADCAAALAELGVELIATETLSMRDEVALFREAELVVGADGAGMVNSVFAPSGASVIELFSSTYFYPQIIELAAVKGHRYGLLFGEPAARQLGIRGYDHDFSVDVDRLTALVRSALGGS